ncbi:MAG: ABC transporter permease [Caldilineaceae bacterium SB0665_bin_25]|nr:ABC transporter permease [Caldilineaceae bacterium SB0665_bin_25]
MLDYVIRRVLIAIPTLLLISFICFVVINLPAGDVITTYEQNLVGNRGWGEEEARIEGDNIRREYGLDRPIPVQYFYWLFAFLQGDFGVSLVTYDRVASEVIWTNLGYTMLIASLSLGLSWAVGLPVGIYSATRQYSVSDNVFTVMSFIGLSMPGFLLALAILVYMTFVLDLPLLTGLYSPEYADAPWSFGRVKDLAAHIWLPVFVGGIPGIASLMRIMRGNLLDELGRQYVETARAKGMAEKIVVIKHAVRVAINPLISLLGMQFPEIVSGGVITAIVLGLRTIGPTLNSALQAQDVYVASAILMLLSVLLVLGNLVADLLLAWVDPRVRFD